MADDSPGSADLVEPAPAQVTERVGEFEMRMEAAERTEEANRRWAQRADALAAWLLSEWQRERKEAA